MNEPRLEAFSSMDRQPQPRQESLTTDHSSGTQRNRSNEGIHYHDGTFDDGILLHDTEAAVHSSSQEQHQQEQYIEQEKETNDEEDRYHQDEMIIVHSVPIPLLTHSTQSVLATIGKPTREPTNARGSVSRESDLSSLRSYSPPQSSEKDLIRSAKSNSESGSLCSRRQHTSRTARGASTAAYADEAQAAAGISEDIEAASYPDKVRASGASLQGAQAESTPQKANRAQRGPTCDSLSSLATDCSIKRHSIVFQSKDPDLLSSDDDESGRHPSMEDMEVMDLRPNTDPNVHRMDTCSLVSFGSNASTNNEMVSGLYQVASGEYHNSDWELQAGDGSARSTGQGDFLHQSLPKLWDQTLGDEESGFVGRGSVLVESSGEGCHGNANSKVNPLVESELVYHTLLTLMQQDNRPTQDGIDGNGNKTFKRRSSVGSVDTSMSGIRSSKSSESMKAERRQRNFTRMCARAMVGAMALAALIGLMYMIWVEKSFGDLRISERLLGNSSNGEQKESHDE
ncbi:hypothetical protein ACHAW5_002736 [Stephanodiscus triporus]|uniref:Uncharacterized protein n=1 Tax=Stephanodiscus triporus TaxID=2934178 RepID=A0ABD3P960_9STRA